MGYVIFRKECSQISTDNIIAPRDFEFKIWEPSTFRLYPKGVNGGRKLDFILTWILYFFLNSGRKKFYKAYLICDEEEVIHHSVVTTKSFKYPFMRENDLQIGMIFTQSEFRRKGLASYALEEILRMYEKPERAIWYITEKNNLTSRRLAEKLGFSEFGPAIRRKIILLGRYELLIENEKLCEEAPDYSSITESPGLRASQEQVARLYQRYHFAKELAVDKDVLEIGCGAGLGLGYLAKVAKKVVGGDVEEKNVTLAREYYKNRQNITADLMDAQNVSLSNESFDLVLLFETIYYLRDPKRCIAEAARLLRPNGTFVVCTVNKDWEDFHPSPYTYSYFSGPELYDLMRKSFWEIRLYGGFSTEHRGPSGEILSLIKRSAVKFNLIPGSLKGRVYLKRIFMGKLILLPHEITESMTDYEPPIEIPIDKVNKDFKILYAVGKKL